jgi:hypothetical protein
LSDRDEIEATWRVLQQLTRAPEATAAVRVMPAALGAGLLQASGDAVLAVLRAGTGWSTANFDLVVEALEVRDWPGDQVLVGQLWAARDGLGTGRKALGVDLDELGEVAGDPQGGYLDLATGFVWPMTLVDDGLLEDHPEEEPERWIYVPGVDGRVAWQDMADFTAQIADASARKDLDGSIHGSKAFRRFQDALNRHERYRVHWRVFISERRLGRAREWLAEQGYDAVIA